VRGEAALKSVVREQFRVESELEVIHEPTGITFSAYPYSNPDDMLKSITANWGSAEDESGVIEGYARADISRMAAEILLEQARRERT
jgi:hypothetical protein